MSDLEEAFWKQLNELTGTVIVLQQGFMDKKELALAKLKIKVLGAELNKVRVRKDFEDE